MIICKPYRNLAMNLKPFVHILVILLPIQTLFAHQGILIGDPNTLAKASSPMRIADVLRSSPYVQTRLSQSSDEQKGVYDTTIRGFKHSITTFNYSPLYIINTVSIDAQLLPEALYSSIYALPWAQSQILGSSSELALSTEAISQGLESTWEQGRHNTEGKWFSNARIRFGSHSQQQTFSMAIQQQRNHEIKGSTRDYARIRLADLNQDGSIAIGETYGLSFNAQNGQFQDPDTGVRTWISLSPCDQPLFETRNNGALSQSSVDLSSQPGYVAEAFVTKGGLSAADIGDSSGSLCAYPYTQNTWLQPRREKTSAVFSYRYNPNNVSASVDGFALHHAAQHHDAPVGTYLANKEVVMKLTNLKPDELAERIRSANPPLVDLDDNVLLEGLRTEGFRLTPLGDRDQTHTSFIYTLLSRLQWQTHPTFHIELAHTIAHLLGSNIGRNYVDWTSVEHISTNQNLSGEQAFERLSATTHADIQSHQQSLHASMRVAVHTPFTDKHATLQLLHDYTHLDHSRRHDIRTQSYLVGGGGGKSSKAKRVHHATTLESKLPLHDLWNANVSLTRWQVSDIPQTQLTYTIQSSLSIGHWLGLTNLNLMSVRSKSIVPLALTEFGLKEGWSGSIVNAAMPWLNIPEGPRNVFSAVQIHQNFQHDPMRSYTTVVGIQYKPSTKAKASTLQLLYTLNDDYDSWTTGSLLLPEVVYDFDNHPEYVCYEGTGGYCWRIEVPGPVQRKGNTHKSRTLFAKAFAPYTVPPSKASLLGISNTLTLQGSMELAWVTHDFEKSFISPSHFVNQLAKKPHFHLNTLLEAHAGSWIFYAKNHSIGSYCALTGSPRCIKARLGSTQHLGLGFQHAHLSIYLVVDNIFNSLPSPLWSHSLYNAPLQRGVQSLTQHNNPEAYDEGRALALRLQYSY